jgi:hypothetical protein
MNNDYHSDREEEHIELPPDLKALEAKIAALRPRTDRLDRDRLVFLAGQASTRGVAPISYARWGWPVSFSAMTALAASLLLMLITRPEPRVVERVVRVPVTVEPAGDRPASMMAATGSTAVSAPRDGWAADRFAIDERPASRVIDPRFRLFEHLVTEFTLPARPTTLAAANGGEDVNDSIWSVGSFRDLGDDTVPPRPDSGAHYGPTTHHSGANS